MWSRLRVRFWDFPCSNLKKWRYYFLRSSGLEGGAGLAAGAAC